MYWPPAFTPNNLVTVSDQLYVANTSLPPRFAAYIQPATILSPWLARADQDTRWSSGDPMFRVLLQGDPHVAVPTTNNSGNGAIVTLCDPSPGVQAFELVSMMDWYAQGLAAKVGAIAWGRIWPAYTPPPPPPAPPSFGFANNGLVPGVGGFTDTPSIIPSGYVTFCLVVNDPASLPLTVSIDGQPISLLTSYAPAATNTHMAIFGGMYATTGAPAIINVTYTGTAYWAFIVNVWPTCTTNAGMPTGANQGPVLPPSVSSGSLTIMPVSTGLFFQVETGGGSGSEVFDLPVAFAFGVVTTAGWPANIRFCLGYQNYSSVQLIITAMSLNTNASWSMVCTAIY